MIALLALIGGGLYLGHRQAKARASLDALGSKVPDNLIAPTDATVADDNTGLPIASKGPPAPVDALSAIPLTAEQANPGVATSPQTFVGEDVKMYFDEAIKDPAYSDVGWGQTKKEQSAAREEKNATRDELWQQQKKVQP